jgi:hypothetical protein
MGIAWSKSLKARWDSMSGVLGFNERRAEIQYTAHGPLLGRIPCAISVPHTGIPRAAHDAQTMEFIRAKFSQCPCHRFQGTRHVPCIAASNIEIIHRYHIHILLPN